MQLLVEQPEKADCAVHICIRPLHRLAFIRRSHKKTDRAVVYTDHLHRQHRLEDSWSFRLPFNKWALLPLSTPTACGRFSTYARGAILRAWEATDVDSLRRAWCPCSNHCGAENSQMRVHSVQVRDIFVHFVTAGACSVHGMDLNRSRPGAACPRYQPGYPAPPAYLPRRQPCSAQ
jgi:hypothetical protein